VLSRLVDVSSSSSSESGWGGDSKGSHAAFTAAAAVRLQVRWMDESPSRRAVDVASHAVHVTSYAVNVASHAAPLHTAPPGDADIRRLESRDRAKQHPVVGTRSSSSAINDNRVTASKRGDDLSCTSVRTATRKSGTS